jgi:hypothetical protein
MHRSIDPSPRRRARRDKIGYVRLRFLSAQAGVRSATARLTGPHAHPALHLRVTADDGASLVDLRRHIDEVAVPRLVGALELPALDTDVLLRLTTR